MNFIEIARAWKKAANPTQEDLDIAAQRHKICAGGGGQPKCEEYKILAGMMPYCAACLCPIDKKIFATSKESCPLRKWTV